MSDLGLHCLPRPTCPKTKDHYGGRGIDFLYEAAKGVCFHFNRVGRQGTLLCKEINIGYL